MIEPDCPKFLIELVERFDRNIEAYKQGTFNETQVRREFIDPLFELLEWDMTNKQGFAEAYKDVIHEDAIKIGGGGTTKAPDYCFRIGGQRKFFLEAKKPAVNVKDDPGAAFQLRRYAWSAKLPLSILTDFEEFAVYDCRTKPAPTDKSSVARILYFTYKDYPVKWREIVDIFAKSSILKGSFDKFADSTKKMRGTAEVDESFLTDIENWRESLAKNIALRNPTISQPALNFAVQQTIDRVIFLRICEDRGVEAYGTLRDLTQGGNTYEKLAKWFVQCDEKYNSGLFHFKKAANRPSSPDSLTLQLKIDDKPLKDILGRLYYPESPYEFSVISSEILGQVYEQFLGRVIVLNAKHQAVIEEKPLVKKAGGVVYTPDFVVKYLVRNTLGALLDEKKDLKPETQLEFAKSLKIIDPACGSGSFLLEAFQYLLDWFLRFYQENMPKSKAIYKTEEDVWKLGTELRKQILVNSIFGLDIDSQAVEVTKLSLLLKTLEGERQLKLYQKHILPDLGDNIKCGNSLIDSGIAGLGVNGKVLEEVNPFDWPVEFSEQIKTGGFDVIIGNPPYIRYQLLHKDTFEYLDKNYATAHGNYDIYGLFIERGLKLLSKRGKLGFIVPNKFFNVDYGEPLRKLLAEKPQIESLVNFEHAQLFKKRATYTALVFATKTKQDTVRYAALGGLFKTGGLTAIRQSLSTDHRLEFADVKIAQGGDVWDFGVSETKALYKRVKSKFTTKLIDVADIFVGVQTSADPVYIIFPNETSAKTVSFYWNNKKWTIERDVLRPFLQDVSLTAYSRPLPNAWIIFPYDMVQTGNSRNQTRARLIQPTEFAKNYPGCWEYLNARRDELIRKPGSETDRSITGGPIAERQWYQYGRSQSLTKMDEPKIILPALSLEARYAFDDQRLVVGGGGNGPYYLIRAKSIPKVTNHYLLAILCHPLTEALIRSNTSVFGGGYYSHGKQFIEDLPIPLVADAKRRAIEELVTRAIDARTQAAAATTPHERETKRREGDYLSKEIEVKVSAVFELSDDDLMTLQPAPLPIAEC